MDTGSSGSSTSGGISRSEYQVFSQLDRRSARPPRSSSMRRNAGSSSMPPRTGMMQIAAWSGMAAGSPDSSFFGALFEAPCENCLAVLNGSQEERDDPQSAAGAKGTLIAGDAPRPLEIFPPGVSFELDDHPPALSGIRLAPSHGPPRGC